MELIAEINTFKLYYVADGHYLHSVWTGFSIHEEFKQGFELILKAVIERGVSRVLVDGREAVMATKTNQDWMNNNFLPQAIPLGYKIVAVVYPHDVIGQATTAKAMESFQEETQKIDTGFCLAAFTNQKEALSWLKAQS